MFFPKLSQISTHQVTTLADSHTIQQAVDLMDQASLRDLVITGEAGFRMITARELIALRLQEVDFSDTLASVNLQKINALYQDATVIDGLSALKEGHFEYLCLINDEGQLSGIVSYSDMAAHLDPHYLSEFKRIDDLIHLSDFLSVDAQAPLKKVLIAMREQQQTAALIKSTNDQHIGIVTQKDITHAIAQNLSVETPVSEIMVSPLITLDGQASLQQALSFSREKKLKRLVVTHNNKVVGLLHQKDLVALVYEKWRNLLDEQQRHLQAERELFKNGPVMLFSWQPTGYWPVKFVSDNVQDILGYSAQEMMQEGFEFGQIVHPDDLDKTANELEKALADKVEFIKQSYRIIDKQGVVHWIYDYTRPAYDAKGEVMSVYGYLIDQTEQIQAKLETERAQQRLELALEASETGLWVWDMQTNNISWSDQAYRQLGYAPQAFEVTLESFQARLHPDDVQPMFAQIQRQMAQNSGFNVEFRFKNAQGGWTWLQGRGRVTKSNPQGEPIEMMGVHIDISATKKIEKDIRLERKRLENIIWGTGVGTWEWNVQTGQTFFNQRWAQLIGYELTELEPTTIDTWMAFAHPDDLAESEKQLMAHFNGEVDHYEVEARMRHKNGDWIWVLDRGKVVSWTADGKPEWMAGTHQEITDRVIKQQALAIAQHQAEAANQAKSEFLANMSHEIRTPMNGIIGLSELAMKQDDVDILHEQLNKIYQSGRLLLGIINDILDFSKIEAGKLEMDPQPFFMGRLFDGLASLFAVQLDAKPVKLRLEMHGLEKRAFVADSLRLRQVLLNLLGNAIKFTEQGEVVLSVSECQKNQNDNQAWLCFEIKDTGMGMSPEQQSKLFQAFHQADTSITRKHGGTGLGLVISQRLIQLLGGHAIEVESALGQGSCFRFSLPLYPATEQQITCIKTHSMHQGDGARLKGHVLLVEDNEINQEVARNQLGNLGLQVTLAENGREALDLCRDQHFDLVLMDIQMPVMDGYQATRAIREFDGDTPIIALTAAAMIEDKKKALAAGMNSHLSKPINIEELRVLLSNYLTTQKAEKNTAEGKIEVERMSQPTTSFGQSSFINHEQGLVQLNGNQALYSKLLSKFGVQLTQDYADLVPDLEALLKTSNIEQAQWQKLQQLNHALKGVAGNLAIDGLFKLSQQIDLLLKQQQVPPAALIAQFAETFEATRALLTAATESASTSQVASDRSLSVSEINSLLVRVKNSEYIDDEEFAELSAKIPEKHHQAWLVFQQYLDAFEFEKAAEALAGIID